jgi:apolipoprotein N-acyltransferase
VYKLWANPLLRSRYPLAIGAGLLWAASFPNMGVAGFAWVAPGLMIAAALGTKGGESFRLGYVAGVVHYLVMLDWLLLIPYRWHGLPLGPGLGWLALSAFLGLFPATWVWLMTPIARQATSETAKDGTRETSPALSTRSAQIAASGLGGILPANWLVRLGWTLSGAAAWVGWEMFLARIFGGFPWDLLGVSQYRLTPLIQISSVTGVYGLSFLAVWVSLSLASAGVMLIQRPTARSIWVGEVFVPVIAVAVLFNLGFRQLKSQEPPDRALQVTMLQPSIPQTLIWDPSKDTERFGELIRLSEQALTNQTDLLIWPEAAVPKLLRYDKETFDQVTSLARRHHVWMVVGSDDAEPRRNASDREETDYFNSAFLISPEGQLVERYIKRNLVIFGEYIPLMRWLPFLKYFTPIEGGFTAGSHAVSFDLKSLKAKTQVLICFEDVFPHLARNDVRADTDFLLNLTNDGWFGEGSAQWQQAATGLFRAVENRLPLLRCSNNGVTCWIDSRGVLREVFRDQSGRIYGKGFLTAEIPLADGARNHKPTFYTRHGDWFGWVCVGFGCLALTRRVAKLKTRAAL